jgi:hypothetical protein
MCEETQDRSEDCYLGVLDTALFITASVPAIKENEDPIANLEKLVTKSTETQAVRFVRGNTWLKV